MAEAAFAASVLPNRSSPAADSPARRMLRRVVRRKSAVLGLLVIALFVALALLAPLVSPYVPTAQDWSAVRKAFTWASGSRSNLAARSMSCQNLSAGIGGAVIDPPRSCLGDMIKTIQRDG